MSVSELRPWPDLRWDLHRLAIPKSAEIIGEAAHHWRYDRTTRLFDLVPGRRPAGYVVASEDSRAFDDPGVFVEIPLVNGIRPRVKAWREAGWPATSAVTRCLLQNWNDPEEFETRRFFFCKIEAVETLPGPPSPRPVGGTRRSPCSTGS